VFNTSAEPFIVPLKTKPEKTIDSNTTAKRMYASPSPGTIAPAVVTTTGSKLFRSTIPAHAARNNIPPFDLKKYNINKGSTKNSIAGNSNSILLV
jgi:hypothetical protein